MSNVFRVVPYQDALEILMRVLVEAKKLESEHREIKNRRLPRKINEELYYTGKLLGETLQLLNKKTCAAWAEILSLYTDEEDLPSGAQLYIYALQLVKGQSISINELELRALIRIAKENSLMKVLEIAPTAFDPQSKLDLYYGTTWKAYMFDRFGSRDEEAKKNEEAKKRGIATALVKFGPFRRVEFTYFATELEEENTYFGRVSIHKQDSFISLDLDSPGAKNKDLRSYYYIGAGMSPPELILGQYLNRHEKFIFCGTIILIKAKTEDEVKNFKLAFYEWQKAKDIIPEPVRLFFEFWENSYIENPTQINSLDSLQKLVDKINRRRSEDDTTTS